MCVFLKMTLKGQSTKIKLKLLFNSQLIVLMLYAYLSTQNTK